MRWLLATLAALVLSVAAHAVQPDEVLKDPALETRARNLSAGLRCLVCQNESIDDSNAPLARDLRLLVRERLVAGDSDAQVKAFLVARYGEFVLLSPPFSARTAVLYVGPFLVLLIGGIGLFAAARRRKVQPVAAAAPLSSDEQHKLESRLRDNRGS
jgi:cytochrome c-type biogenesis protein CcmH